MKNNNKLDIHKQVHDRFQSQDKFYGTTTMGSRGQVVIPATARKELNLNPGDQLVVMGKFGNVLGLMKTDAMSGIVDTIMKNLEGTGMEKRAKEHMEKMFGKINKKIK